MPDPFELLGRMARTLDAIPVAARIGAATHRAFIAQCEYCGNSGVLVDPATGERALCPCTEERARALGYLAGHGWREALDVARPGLGTAVQTSIRRTRDAAHETAHVVGGKAIDATFRELPMAPWEGFARELRQLEWGSVAVFGPPGAGKTMTILRLAEGLRETTGYPVETVQLYWDDAPAWIRPIGVGELVRRVALLRSAIGDSFRRVDSAGPWLPDPAKLRQLERVKGRILLVDEGLLLELAPGSAERDAIETAIMQARHLGWIVLVAAQLMSQLPKAILTAGIMMLKDPGLADDLTLEAAFDRDERAVRALWDRAGGAFATAPIDYREWWRGVYADPRAWVYVHARYPIRYTGMMPIRLPQLPEAA